MRGGDRLVAHAPLAAVAAAARPLLGVWAGTESGGGLSEQAASLQHSNDDAIAAGVLASTALRQRIQQAHGRPLWPAAARRPSSRSA